MKKILEKRARPVQEPISKSQSLHLLIYKSIFLNKKEDFSKSN